MKGNALREVIKEMKAPVSSLDYYALSVYANEKKTIQWDVQSHFVGSKSRTPLIELRAATRIVPEAMIKLWRSAGQSGCIVSNQKHLFVYLQIGGNAAIEVSIAERLLPFIREPFECRPVGVAGFEEGRDLPKTALQRAPTRGLRMRVFKRDKYRCRICGRRPTEHVDIELHLHHVRPWADGGATTEDNLITLCGTCHSGLEPHFDKELFNFLGTGEEQLLENSARKSGVERYRAIVKKLCELDMNKKGEGQ